MRLGGMNTSLQAMALVRVVMLSISQAAVRSIKERCTPLAYGECLDLRDPGRAEPLPRRLPLWCTACTVRTPGAAQVDPEVAVHKARCDSQ